MDEWYIVYYDAAGEEQLDCVKAESAIRAIENFHNQQPPIEWNKVIKVELKR